MPTSACLHSSVPLQDATLCGGWAVKVLRTGGFLQLEANGCGERWAFSDCSAFPGCLWLWGEGKARGSLGAALLFIFVELETAPLGPETGLQLLSPAGTWLPLLDLTFALLVGTAPWGPQVSSLSFCLIFFARGY